MAILFSGRGHHSLLRLLSSHHHRSLSAASDTSAAGIPAGHAISLLRKEQNPDKAISILSIISPSDSTPAAGRSVDIAVRLLSRARRDSDIKTLISSRKSSLAASHEPFLASLILAYGTAGMTHLALALFHEVPILTSSPPTVLSFNALLKAFARAHEPGAIPDIFATLTKQYPIIPDISSYILLIKSLCSTGQSDTALQILADMETKGVTPTPAIYNAIIKSKNRDRSAPALQDLTNVKDKGIKPTTAFYTTAINTLYKQKKPEEAEKIWREAVSNGWAPNDIAYKAKSHHLAGCGTPEQVQAVIAEMKAAGLKPDSYIYNSLLVAYLNNNQFENAKKLYMKLLKKDDDLSCGPNALTYKIYLNYLCGSGDIDAASAVYNDALSIDLMPDVPTTDVFVEKLVEGSRVVEAKTLIAKLKEKFNGYFHPAWSNIEKKHGLMEDSDQLEAAA